MKVLRQASDLKRELKRYSARGLRIGFVPTMGALHRGHARLIQAARKSNDIVVVSIFVNPLQFGPSEDYSKYPRDLAADADVCRRSGADVIFAPDAEKFLKMKSLVKVSANRGLKSRLCGPVRPGHFDGVATIVAHFFRVVRPDKAYFGLKDYQQYLVVREMSKRLFGSKIEIVAIPTEREVSGLALSSRNRYLKSADRRIASNLHVAMSRVRTRIRSGRLTAPQAQKALRDDLVNSGPFRIQYLEVVDAETLHALNGKLDPKKRGVLIAAAVYLGSTRLIDNVLV